MTIVYILLGIVIVLLLLIWSEVKDNGKRATKVAELFAERIEDMESVLADVKENTDKDVPEDLDSI